MSVFLRLAGWRADGGYPADLTPTVAAMDRAADEIMGWPVYEPTPLRELPGLARALDLGAVLCKDESARFGVGGVKALGAPYGLRWLLEERPGDPAGGWTAIAATDGNHGLALAWAARRLGGRARIFVGRAVDDGRLDRIRAQGAEITVVEGTYDDAVLAAEALAAADPRARLVTDTDYDGTRPVAGAIMAGYALLAAEAWERGLAVSPPTHVVLPCGVGGLAGGVVAGLWRRMGDARPRVVTVEPERAACVRESLRAGAVVQISGTLETRMAGLACGRPSRPAWEVLARTAFAALAISDQMAESAQRGLAAGVWGDPPLAAGDTGVAGLAGLIAAATDPVARAALELGPASRVFTINSEGPSPARLDNARPEGPSCRASPSTE